MLKRSSKGFTLIEMLLVTSLLAMTGLAVYHSLANGLKVWQAGNRYTQEQDIALFFEKIGQDLRNATDYSLIEFEGKENTLSFATIVRTPARDQAGYISQIGRVEYQFDSLKGMILRRQFDYGDSVGQGFEQKVAPFRSMVQLVSDVKFSYYVPESNKIVLKESTEENWPAGVLIEVNFLSDGKTKNTMSKLVAIPSGNHL